MKRLRILLPAILSFFLIGCEEKGDTEIQASALPREVPDHFLRFLNDSGINDEVMTVEYSNAYYDAVDPLDRRTTLEGWKAANDFDLCSEDDPDHQLVHVVFRDTKDLGYGRNMTACRHNDGRVAVFVNNYVVKVLPGDPTNYGPLNLEAAIREDQAHLAGTNAIEFSPVDGGDPDRFAAKFYTFAPNGDRNVEADLDGRGAKPVPQPCLVCHGTRLMPLTDEGDLPEEAIFTAKMNQLEVDSFEYSSVHAGFTREALEEGLREINGFVRDTYAEMNSYCDANLNPGCWYGEFALDLVEGRYDGNLDVPDTVFNEDFVPEGWQESPERPAGVSLLFTRVIQPHCAACHSLRGTRVAENNFSSLRQGSAINFESYEKFIGYSDIVNDYVFLRGVMPLSLRNYEKFWEDRDGAPAILASFIPEFDRYDDDGRVIVPGMPYANPGADRIVTTPTTLSAAGSLFARSYQWELISQPLASDASLVTPTAEQTQFTADTDGDYVVRLTATNLRGTDVREITVTVDNALSVISKSPDALRFDVDILPLMQVADQPGVATRCVFCHDPESNTDYEGIPVAYTSDEDLFANVLARVDLDDPENSILVRKPTRIQHGGGVVIDRETEQGALVYNRILNWIRNGAPCGTDGLICSP